MSDIVWVTGDRVFTGDAFHERYAVAIEDERIAGVGPQADLPADANVAARADLVAPGFIDLQINGAGGVLFNDDTTVAGLETIVAATQATGVPYLLPTLISSTPETMAAAIAAVDAGISDDLPGVLGIHLEGPYLSEAKHGAHDTRYIRGAELADVDGLAALSHGKTLVTLAPETAAPGVVRALTDRGVCVFAGHTNGTYDDYRRAADEGLRGFTHLFNAMSPLTVREPGAAGAALALDETFVTMIADGHHVHPAALKTAVRAKPRGKAVLITDAMPTLGTDLDGFELDGRWIALDGGRLTDDAGGLAGAHLRLDEAVRNIQAFAGVDQAEALRMASTYPAHVLGLERELGRIAVGMRAGLTLLAEDGTACAAMADGQLVDAS